MLVDVGEWAGTSIEEQGGMDETSPPHVAVSCGKEPVVNLLLSNVADVSAKNIGRLTPLQCAAAQGHNGVLLLLRDAEVTPPVAPSPAPFSSFWQFGVFPEQASHLNRCNGCVGWPSPCTLRRDRQ